MRATHCDSVRLGVMLFLLCCIWTTSPMIVLGQTYYVNFVFNNSPYYPGVDSQNGPSRREHPKKHKHKHESRDTREISENEISDASDKCPNTDERCGGDHSSDQSWDIIEITPPSTRRTTQQTTKKTKKKTTKKTKKKTTTTVQTPCATTPQTNQETTTKGSMGTQETTTKGSTGTSCFSTTPDGQTSTSDTMVIEIATTNGPNYSRMVKDSTTPQGIIEITTTTSQWMLPTPRPSECFEYPQAKCQEDMYLHEFFGIALQQDQGLAAKVSCEFQNEWSGTWLLMTRIELPVRVHTRHWFFGYLTDDYKDFNINLMSLAYIMNRMRLALLIIGQDNNGQLVYNLYDDFVISGFNDLFMLRKAHLVEANTTDLLYPSVGEVLETNTGHNRSCPFAVMGAWWGTKGYCVFPVDRNIKRPGYVAFFIKPNPFQVNNTAFYANEITTRRPWAATVDPQLMAQANNDWGTYNELKERRFFANKKRVRQEIIRRGDLVGKIEFARKAEEKAAAGKT